MGDTQTCGRRMQECGPWEHDENLDRWVTDRWLTDPAAVQAKHEAEQARSKARAEADGWGSRWTPTQYGATTDLWLWSWGPPRTCNFCGGIHPEDAIRLVEEGWEVDTTGKSYKRYLNPPGFYSQHDAFMASCKRGEPGVGVPSVWSPGPPVKVYIQHFSEEQIARFNAALKPTGA